MATRDPRCPTHLAYVMGLNRMRHCPILGCDWVWDPNASGNLDRAVANSPPRCPDLDQEAPDPDEAGGYVGLMRKFDTGATRNLDDDKLDFEGFLSPLALEAFARYMHKHRRQADGTLRDGDNWQKGIPFSSFMKSGLRHVHQWWKLYRELSGTIRDEADPHKLDDIEDALCGVLFNAMGFLHEHLKTRKKHGVP